MDIPARRRQRAGPGLHGASAVGIALFTLVSTTAAAYTLREEKIVVLNVDFLQVEREGTATLASRSLDILPRSGGALELDLPWEASGAPARVRLDAAGRPGDRDAPHHVSLQTIMSVRGTSVHASRSFELPEGGTALMDAFEADGRRLVLAVRAEAATRPVAVRPSGSLRPVRFSLGVERIDGERRVPLESNLLQTFVGEGVEYAFRRGDGDEAESVRLWLRPIRIEGDVVELEIDVSGSLPGEPHRLVLSRRDAVFSSRGATSPVVVATGKPPAGYRFLITPEF